MTPQDTNWKSRGIFINQDCGIGSRSFQRRMTMKDIAEKVGVTTMTVSRALSGGENVSQQTKAKIEAVARELGYKNECEKCGSKDCIVSVRFAGEIRKLFCGKKCLAEFYSE